MRLMRSNPVPLLLVIVAIWGSVNATRASVITVTGDPADYYTRYRYNSSLLLAPDVTQSMVAGQYFANGADVRGANAVLVFEMPELSVGEAIDGASLKIRIATSYPLSNTSNPFSIDLWGIGFQNSTAAINKYLDTDTSSDPSMVKLLDDWIDEGEHVSPETPDTGNNANLSNYLKDFYDTHPGYDPDVTPWYVFLLLNPDQNPTNSTVVGGRTGYEINRGENSTASFRPSLTIVTAVPEPAGLVLLSLGGLAVCRRRRGN